MANNISYDTLTIQINADSKNASNSIKKLSNNLLELNETAKKIDSDRIEQVKALLLDISKIDFSNVSHGLESVTKAFDTFHKTSLVSVLKTLDINSLSNEAKQSLDGLVVQMAKVESESFGSAEEIETLTSSVEGLDKAVNKATSNINGLSKETKTAKENAKDFGDTLSKVAQQFKNILKYRIIRKVIQDIYKAIQEGFDNVLAFDTGLQDSFNKLNDSFAYLKDSLGALISPLVQMVAPVLIIIADLVGDLANELAKMFAIVNGQNGYAKAIKGEKDWAKAKEKTQSMGIDELNVLNQDNGGGNFEWVELATDETKGLGKSLESVGKIIASLSGLIEPIVEVLSVVFDIIGDIFERLTPLFNLFATNIEMGTNLFKIFIALLKGDFNEISKLWGNVCEGFKDIFKNVINFFITAINKFIGGVVDMVNTLSGSGIAKFFGFDGWDIDLPRIPMLTSGGFPEDGFFFANHTELVGKFSNGQTAVANNQDIQQGIYEAVLSAMRESGGNQGVVVNLDGYKLAEIVTKRQNNMGQTLVYGGNLNYGK